MSRCFLARFVLVLLQALGAGTGLPPRSPPPAPTPHTPASPAHTPHTLPHLVSRHTAHSCDVECQLAEGSTRSQMSCKTALSTPHYSVKCYTRCVALSGFGSEPKQLTRVTSTLRPNVYQTVVKHPVRAAPLAERGTRHVSMHRVPCDVEANTRASTYSWLLLLLVIVIT
ncbi:unnamed protein product, partial [Brenthis ino]